MTDKSKEIRQWTEALGQAAAHQNEGEADWRVAMILLGSRARGFSPDAALAKRPGTRLEIGTGRSLSGPVKREPFSEEGEHV